MKPFIVAALLVSGLTIAGSGKSYAQTDTTVKDSTVVKKKRTYSVTYTLNGGESEKKDSIARAKGKKGRFVGGITFTRVDLGYSRLVDNGSFTLTPENEFLDYKGGKTSTFSFDILQMGYRFGSNFKIYVAGGFDWTHIRLRKDITIERNKQTLSYTEDPIHYSKNRFSSSYVHIPLNFEFRTDENDNGNRFYFVIGPEVGFLLNGKVKQISDENGKQKFKDDYHFQAFRYGGTVRIGYGGFGLFTKVYANDIFATTAQKGLTNMSFGVTFGLN